MYPEGENSWCSYNKAKAGTSTDDRPVHHMCPEGENSWCSYNKTKAGNKLDEYKNGFDPIQQAIVQLLKPIYNRLGS